MAERFDVHAQHRIRSGLFTEPRLLGGCGVAVRGARLHQLLHLLGLVGEVVAQHQSAQVLQHGNQVDHLRVVAGRPQRLRQVPGEPDSIKRGLQGGGVTLRQRTGPLPQGVCGQPHAADADQRNDAPQGQHRPVALDLGALHLRAVERSQQLEAERHVFQHLVGDLVGVLPFQARDPRHSRRQARQGRQVADALQAVQQEAERAAAIMLFRFEPAGECAQ